MADTNYLECWYTAANSEFGAVFETNNPTSVKQQLLTARKAAADPMIEGLIIRPSPINPQHLWIIKPQRLAEVKADGSNLKELNI